MTKDDEQQLIMAKLNGDWDSPSYRFHLMTDWKCLNVLQHDKFSLISDGAKQKLKAIENKRK